MMVRAFSSKLWRKAGLIFAFLVLFSLALSPVTPTMGSQSESQPTPPTVSSDPTGQAVPLTEPTIIVDEFVNTYLITDGLLYWGDYCWGDEFRWDGYLRRAPSHGGAIRPLQNTTPADCATFWFMAADTTGIYYVDLDGDQIEFRSASNPTNAVILYTGGLVTINMTNLALDDTYIYWGDTFTQIIYRLPKAGGTPTPIYTDYSGGLQGLVHWAVWLFFLDSGGLSYCTTPSCGSLTLIPDSAAGTALVATPNGLFYVETSSPPKIHYVTCIFSCVDFQLYTAPVGWTIYSVAPGLCADGSYCLYWIEYLSGNNAKLERRPFWGGTMDTIADGLPGNTTIATDDQGVYFTLPTTSYLARLPFNATEVQRDLRAAAWEVTQTIQSLSNDVPLVARKTTYVRLYPSLTGEHANFVHAELYGWRSGTPLPGSPLSPLGGTIDLSSTYVYNRADQYSGYLFQLPESWTEPGVTSLQGIVDPDEVYADQTPGNNALSSDFTFGNKPPVCDIFIPVRTNTPPASTSAPNFWRMIDLHKRLWPVPDVWVYRQDSDVSEPEFCWKWGFIPWSCDGPFELDEGSSWSDWIPDAGEALLHISTRATFTDDPDECPGAVHYVGMVHPNAPTGSTTGLAYTYEWMEDASWVKLAPPTFDPPTVFSWPHEGSTLAHETSHNHARAHVDCGGPDDPDGSYPYPPCQLDDAVDPTHFGFDVNLRDPIAPTEAADYMSYAGDRWASDYTYKAMYNHVSAAATASTSVLSAAANAVQISAKVNTALGESVLDYAWVYPTAGMSQNILGKWESLLAQPFIQSAVNPDLVSYHVRLLDSGGGTLADYVLTPMALDEYAGNASTLIFQQTFDAPAAGMVARLDLMADTTVLVSRQVGTSAPAVTILAPAGGETFSDSLAISWQASDPDGDVLLYNLQYSPDGGLTWKALANAVPGNPEGETSQLELDDLGSLGASNGATGLVRVAASDGYHTTLAVSNAFTVQDQPPEAFIISPELAHIYPAAESVPLRGGGMDPETGGLSGSQLAWSINGIPVGTGEENDIYGLAPGIYFAGLQATDPAANSANAFSLLNIGRLSIPLGSSTPTLDGLCEDEAYGDLVVRLLPDGNNNQARVSLVRASDSLWACFNGMRYIEGQPPGSVGLFADVNNSRDEQAQPDDYAFMVTEDGTPLSAAGNGAGGYNFIGLGGLQAQVSVHAGTWSAELYIPSSRVGDWSHPMGIYLVAIYNWSFSAGVNTMPEAAGIYPWPYASGIAAPSTWAWSLLGTAPTITSLNPDKVTAGGPPFTLTIFGEGFQDGAVAYWGPTALSTTYVTPNQLTAQVGASLFATSGYPLIVVANADTLASDPVILPVENPLPFISHLSPSQLGVGSGGFTLSVIGTNFIDGARIVWNGAALETTFISSSQLQAPITADELEEARQVNVLVKNPEPVGGSSNIKLFNVGSLQLFLPVVTRVK